MEHDLCFIARGEGKSELTMDQGGSSEAESSHGFQKKSLQHRYFRKLARKQNDHMNDGVEETGSSGKLGTTEDTLGYFHIPSRSYSPERLTGRSRSNSTSPIRHPSVLTFGDGALSRSPSPTRRLLTCTHTVRENPFVASNMPTYSYSYPTELRPVTNHDENPFSDMNSSSYPLHDSNNQTAYSKPTTNSVFDNYEFDEDEAGDQLDNEFTPFPTLENSYYPINMPYDVYNPFEAEYSSNDDTNSVEENSNASSASLERRDTAFKNAKAVKDTVFYYDKIDGQHQPETTVGIDKGINPATKQVRMVDGNLVLDCPVSEILLSKYKVPLTERDREFLFMRFQACTAEPENYQEEKFSLRQNFYTKPRETELMIVVTMYNEDEFLLARTLKGIFKNIRYFYNLKHSSTWGTNAWQKIVVCIVSDGRQKINPRSKALLAALGVYQEGFAKNRINDDDVISHIYEYTTMVGISKIYKDHITLTTDNQIPVQMIFCLKEQNQRKINSHKWAFKAFAPLLNPKVIILLDVGTAPESKSLYKLWKSFKDDPHVAGSCGEIKASLGTGWRLLLNPLVAAQNFEYKTSNILDKPMESVFGFVTVLPGAFSAYRYEALIGEPLEKYLKGENLKKNNDDGIFNANMYLAEDRILCFELIAKRNANWILKYINTAGAYTDVPEQLDDFISQRRRWLNGSFFAAVYSVCNFYKIWCTAHSIGRKLTLQVQFFYQLLNLLVSWFSLGSYFLVFRILSCYLAESSIGFPPGNILSVFFLWLYMASLTTTFVLSFGNKPKGTKIFYLIIVVFFAVLMCYMIFAAILLSVKSIQEILDDSKSGFSWKFLFVETQFRNLMIAILSTYVLYFTGFLMFLQPVHMLTSFVQYLLLSPAYVNILNIYAFCNIHDISWGTKGQDKIIDLGIAKKGTSGNQDELEIVIPTTKYQIDDGYSKMVKTLMTPDFSSSDDTLIDPEEKNKFYFAFFRSMTVLVWMFSNFILVAVVTETGGLSQFDNDDNKKDSNDILPSKQTFIFLSVILYIVAFMALFRFVGCTVYLIQRGFNKIRVRT
ncbi:hypothetical protein PMKS-004155 [Pichia membranifaciens]|uniref:chitin synthase n=1 Tax=Pichia membranifaciens TaxID=4926 RepID=A0A1Q2YM65_9ASCO|nr:hypothetical protein PMKS-004155 [Pichia membranifaciens]